MKYKLINRITNQETICEKVIIDGYEYYLTPETPSYTKFYFTKIKDSRGERQVIGQRLDLLDTDYSHCKKIIATTNSNIDIPKVVDEVEELALKHFHCVDKEQIEILDLSRKFELFIEVYNKSQETHPFSEDDMVEFAKFIYEDDGSFLDNKGYPKKELLELWKSQRIKTLYYE